ncbi:glycosyltransferase family 4 protein [candidate division KSB1 bacterium]|nr:glycosyltransferase family 4 protein [candidate division KSB1 bacterium]NIR71067.1 glycosyltransferase family 4 protein [candidate division KSB1 bacterium]NIS24771.1 glycosyltransferase family 4 protein [candidate division KSB1 bacterium]NIT71676.1 glycosyltransferase family 4 protein [candidate division KSB1 bacterium]NIU25383.1 glycosyltransferase family 4 protein [candidate division KSB1 bacterium]
MEKRVCIIHKVTTLDPRSFYKQARSLSKAGYETIILGLQNRDEVIEGIRVIGFPPSRSRLIRILITNFRVLIMAWRLKATVYHFHDLDFVPWALLLKALTRAKIVYDIHEAHPDYMLLKTYIPSVFRQVLSMAVYLMEHMSSKCFDAIVPNDNFVAADFKHRNIQVIYNFPSVDFFNGRYRPPYEKRAFDLFYHGSLPKYHFETMLGIAEKLNALNVRNTWGLIMDRHSPRNWAEREVKKRGLQRNFVFLPYVDYLQVNKYLNQAKIGIIPLPPFKKFMKNIPIKMFEYMGASLPVVLSDLPPTRQFIEGQDCVIAVEPNNIDAYVKAIAWLLSHPKKSMQMGKVGKRLVFERFNWTQQEDKLLNLYQRLFE